MHKENSSISNFKKYVLKILFPVLLIVGVVAAAFCFLFEKYIIFTASNSVELDQLLLVYCKYEMTECEHM